MDALNKAKNLLATQYSNVFILVEDGDGNLWWSGSELFGEGASNKFLRTITDNNHIELEHEDGDED